MLNNYNDVQNALDNFVQQAGVNIGGARHAAFWDNLDYNGFTTGNVPGVPGTWKILVVGDSANSNIIQILSGLGAPTKAFKQMPRPMPPYTGQAALIADLAAWIDAGCPNDAGLNAARTYQPHEEHQK
jgi:hypothetical protein